MNDWREQGGRIWELDFFRGLALILMVIFHLVFNLNEFYDIPVVYTRGPYYYVGKISVILFMIIAGISSYLSNSNLRRGLRLLGIALLITVVTHIWDPEVGIKFGILHFLGVSILIFPFLKRLPTVVLIVLIILLFYLGTLLPVVNYDFLFPLGLKSTTFVSADYYPLIPWLGVFIIGVVAGRCLYQRRKSVFGSSLPAGNPISVIGENTLLIYLVHQPLLLLFLYLLLGPIPG